MSTVRLRRLQADYEAIKRLVRLHPRIRIEGVTGNPPERYRFVLLLPSLRSVDERVEVAGEHRVEVFLPLGYPRDAPLCRMLTPVFHPNIAPHAICIGDTWTAGEPLPSLVQRIGEMLVFQSYNVKSPLNGLAARWAEENAASLPLTREEIFVDLESHARGEQAGDGACVNCGAPAERSCEAGHRVCPDCSTVCPTCARVLCLACGVNRCPVCVPVCANCAQPAALRCVAGHLLCRDCAPVCPRCNRVLCLVCGEFRCPTCPPA